MAVFLERNPDISHDTFLKLMSASRMPLAGPSQSFDYTEGASAIDIDAAVANNRRSRRDSRHSQLYGEAGEGAMFDGPGHSAIPSSVSRMSLDRFGGRRSSDWDNRKRGSQDSVRTQRSRRDSEGSVVSDVRTEAGSGEEEDGQDDISVRRGRRPDRSSPPATRSTVFENLANLFGRGAADEPSRRRPSLSQRSLTSSRYSRWGRRSDAGSEHAVDDDEGEERWGYSSGEEDDEGSVVDNEDAASRSDIEYGSFPASPKSASLPLLSGDPIFGDEARIDIDLPLDDLDPPPPGPPSRQTIYVSDEDSTFRFVGYETILWRHYLWRLLCIVTLGILGLVGHWFPRLWLQWVAIEKAFVDTKHGFVVVEVRSVCMRLSRCSLKQSRLCTETWPCSHFAELTTAITSRLSFLRRRLVPMAVDDLLWHHLLVNQPVALTWVLRCWKNYSLLTTGILGLHWILGLACSI